MNEHDRALSAAFDSQAERFERAPFRAIRSLWSGLPGGPASTSEAACLTPAADRGWSVRHCWRGMPCRGRRPVT